MHDTTESRDAINQSRSLAARLQKLSSTAGCRTQSTAQGGREGRWVRKALAWELGDLCLSYSPACHELHVFSISSLQMRGVIPAHSF